MRISRILAVAVLALSLAACSDATAPNPQQDLQLPPFDSPTMTVFPGGQFITTLRFYAPPGVAPETKVEITNLTMQSPKLKVTKQMSSNDDDCASVGDCSRVPWTLYLIIEAEAEGEAKIGVSLKAKPTEVSTLRVKSSNLSCYDYCKG